MPDDDGDDDDDARFSLQATAFRIAFGKTQPKPAHP